jgi:glycosyltransferase involved in cell wall biosynthesis
MGVVERCLSALEKLNYPDFEWILVDDRSEDGTSEVLRKWSAQRSGAKYVRVDRADFSPKKHALLAGAAEADGEWLALTDADCAPPPEWLEKLAESIVPGCPVVLGYSPYVAGRGLLNFFIRMETERTALEYLGRSALGWNYMAVGRNMAVRRATLLSDGFAGHRTMLSGSDDLLVRRHRTSVCVAGHVPSLPPPTWRAWWRQKTRHVSASAAYAPGTQTALLLIHLGRFALWYSALGRGEWISLALFWLLQWNTYLVAKKFLSLRPNILELAFFDSLLILYHTTLVPAGRIRRPIWKKN